MHAMPLVKPNLSCGIPVYAQLMDQVCRGLSTGAIRPGDVLPGVGRAAEALVVHPGAVDRAYRELEHLQLVARRSDIVLAASGPATSLPRHRTSGLAAMRPSDGGGPSRELTTAAEVQRGLLPATARTIDGLEVAGRSCAALGVGGDYYDFIPAAQGGLGLVIADVCGKGMSAALLMASLRAYLHGAAARGEHDPGGILTATSRLVYDSSPANRFITVFHGHYDPTTRVLTYVNAGHLPPVVLRRTGHGWTRRTLAPTGPAIGMLPGATYQARRVSLAPGDLIVACTDGMSEAQNEAGDEFGEARLLALAEAHGDQPAEALAARALAEAAAFAGPSPQDDMTVLVARAV